MIAVKELVFRQTSGNGTYKGIVTIPAGYSILDILIAQDGSWQTNDHVNIQIAPVDGDDILDSGVIFLDMSGQDLKDQPTRFVQFLDHANASFRNMHTDLANDRDIAVIIEDLNNNGSNGAVTKVIFIIVKAEQIDSVAGIKL